MAFRPWIVDRIRFYFIGSMPFVWLGIGFALTTGSEFPGQAYFLFISWVMASLSIAVVLYMIRREARLVYGIMEALFGIGTILGTLLNLIAIQSRIEQNQLFAGQDRFTAFFLIFAAIYVLVRGFDNVGEGLRKYPDVYARWNSAFPQKD
jgi:hypothetical protein